MTCFCPVSLETGRRPLACAFVDVHNCSLFTVSSWIENERVPSKRWIQSPSSSNQYDEVAIQSRVKFRSQYVKPYNIGVGKLLS